MVIEFTTKKLLLPKDDGFSGAIGSTMSTEVNLKPG